MKKIAISYDNKGYSEKPSKNEIAMINNRIAGSVKEYETDTKSLYEVAMNIGQNGYSFCPATFKDGKRSQDSFEQQQIFALDFDNKDPEHSLRFEDAKKRAEKYDLPVLFAYETLSSHDQNKFRMVFLNDVSIPDRSVANAMLHAMGTIFPEADPQCYSDTSRIYFGGKNLLYYNKELGMINIESVFRSMVNTVRERYGDKHYKEKLIRLSKKTGLSLNHNGLPDVRISYDSPYTSSVESTEDHGASDSTDTTSKMGGIRQSYIIYNYEYSDGENPPKYYSIGINLNAQRTSVGTSDRKADVPLISSKNHKEYRSSVLSDLKQCKLFMEYMNGSRDFVHEELFGLLTNMIQIETGIDYFINVQSDHPKFYDEERISRWKRDASYIKKQGYHPQRCNGFCPHKNTCDHANNILSTIHQKKGTIEKLDDTKEEYCSIEELQEDVYEALITAYTRSNADIFVIKAQTAAGKSHAYLKLMRENPDTRFLIAVPTNLLKHEISDKAKKNGIKANVTPSLQEIADEIPREIWKHIQYLYRIGQGKAVHRYINELLKKAMQNPMKDKRQKKELEVLVKYIKERDRIRKSHDSVITTHRYLLNMDEERLKEYDVIIIDEDILFKGIVSNQEEIPVSVLEKAMEKINDRDVKDKIKDLLKKSKKQSCIHLKRITWKDEEDDTHHKSPVKFDLPSFCLAERFYFRRTAEEENIKEDTVIFVKPMELPNAKYIIVSATADEEIYQQYFSDRTVQFYECKRAKYAGTLRQYPQKSLSRSYIKSNTGIVDRIISGFSVSEENVITFKSEQVGDLHFGNTEGSNTMEGQDILVIGTPNYPASLYKLTAFTMGIDVDEEDEMTSQCVTYNGFKFWITTFEDEDLRAVHFWMLESELEQAVGRERLLRHDCTVYLFSNFPLKQATFVYDFDYEKK